MFPEYVQRFLENSKFRLQNIAAGHRVGKALFGLTTISINPDVLTDLSKNNSRVPEDVTQGLLVWKIIPGTPAHK